VSPLLRRDPVGHESMMREGEICVVTIRRLGGGSVGRRFKPGPDRQGWRRVRPNKGNNGTTHGTQIYHENFTKTVCDDRIFADRDQNNGTEACSAVLSCQAAMPLYSPVYDALHLAVSGGYIALSHICVIMPCERCEWCVLYGRSHLIIPSV
jgi:hypothetical protein